MKKLMFLILVAVLAWSGYSRHQERAAANALPAEPSALMPQRALAAPRQVFVCDGRMHCSQMTSCEEARYFVAHCPDTRMDGDRDGEPCEQQWCN